MQRNGDFKKYFIHFSWKTKIFETKSFSTKRIKHERKIIKKLNNEKKALFHININENQI